MPADLSYWRLRYVSAECRDLLQMRKDGIDEFVSTRGSRRETDVQKGLPRHVELLKARMWRKMLLRRTESEREDGGEEESQRKREGRGLRTRAYLHKDLWETA